MSSPEPPRHAPLALWRAARDLIVTIFNIFGEPEDIAAEHTLTAKSHALLLSWLRTGEALLRRLIFIEASALVSTIPGPPPSRRHARQKHERKLMHFAADEPETWRVTFQCFAPNASSPARGGSADPGLEPGEAKGEVAKAERRFLSAWPLAERAEALLRAYNNPAPYAQRLARRLRAAPKRTATILTPHEDLPHRFGEPHFAILCAACDIAQLTLNST